MAKIDASLISVKKIPEEYRSVFTEFPYFNKIQSAIFDEIINSDKPFVVAAPTGSGKTVIFELAIIRLLKQMDSALLQSTKIIYVAPMKAVCEERYVDWYKKFNRLGLRCVSITGDSNQTFMDMLDYNIIITTPEKWDTLTRRWRNYKKLVSSIKLFLIDEIHLLNEDKRGATLETIVCRMKTIESSLHEDKSSIISNGIRFVAVSATIPNIEDIAEWIGNENNKAAFHSFSEDMRPVKLNKIVIGYPNQNKNAFKFDIMLNYKLQTIIMQYAEGKPTLIFCSTRKSVEMTSKYISQNITVNMTFDQKAVLLNAARAILDNKCKEFLLHGVGYHHAGMLLESRKIVEDLFRNGYLPILVTTSTLAMGVNLPAHLVIIKSTKCFMNGEYRDYSEGTVLQMIGRAGRPQFDTSATAVILTNIRDKIKYESMVDRGQAIESNLHKHLIEHLNADICLRTVTDLGIALQWISSTFLYIRAKKSPQFYGLPANLTDKELDGKLLEMCQIDINKLAFAGMIFMDHVASLTPTHLGYLMADYYIAFETMKVFISIKGNEVLAQMLMILSRCQEFSEMYLRSSDKKSLNLLNKNKNKECIRFPYNSRITNPEMKINCLIQAVFGCLPIVDHSLLNDASKIIRAGQRLTGCLTKYLETRTDCFLALLNSYILAKCFQAKIWENSTFVSRQLSDIGTVRSKLLVDADKTTFQSILDSNPRDLERIMKRKAPFGDNIRDQIMSFPFYQMSLTTKSAEKLIEIKITLTNPEQLINKSDDLMILLVGDDKNNILLHEKYTHGYMKDNMTVEKVVEYDDETLRINANFICDDKVGLDCIEILEINSKTVASNAPENITKATIDASVNKKTNNNKIKLQKTMNNYFPVVNKQKCLLEAQKKHSESPNKENISNNGIVPEIEILEQSTIDFTAEYLKSDMDSQIFLNDISKTQLPPDIKELNEKQKAKCLLLNNREAQSSTRFSQVAALDVIQMLNNKFGAKSKVVAPPKATKSILSRPPVLRNYLAGFEARYKKKLEGTEGKRLATFAQLEDSLCNDYTNVEVPKKKLLSNEGTSIGVADSTVTNDFNYEVVVIEPEQHSQRLNMTPRNITWRSPLTSSSSQAKNSPHQNIFSFSQTVNKNKTIDGTAPSKTIQIPKQIQFTCRSDQNIPPFFPITDRQVEEAELQEMPSSLNSFVDPDLFATFRSDGQRDTNKSLNVSVSSSKAIYEHNPPCIYYKSLEELTSPKKDAADNCSVTKANVEQTDNFEGLLNDDEGNEYLQQAMLESFDNVMRDEDARLLTKNSPTAYVNDSNFNTPKTTSISTKLSSKSIMDSDEDNNQLDEEQFTPQFVAAQQQDFPRQQINPSQTRTHHESYLDHFNVTQIYSTQPKDSPPRIEFVRNYIDAPQTSRYFDRSRGHQGISSYASQRDNFHNNSMQSQRGLMNQSYSQIDEPNFLNRSKYTSPADGPFPLNPRQYFHQNIDRPLRYGDECFTRTNPLPYQRQNCSSQMLHHPYQERPAANNFRYTDQFNPYLQYDNSSYMTQQPNDRTFINRYPSNRMMNSGPSNAFGSLQEQTLNNERYQQGNSVGMFHQNQNRFIDFPQSRQARQFRMPQIDLCEPYGNYSGHQSSHIDSARRIGSQNFIDQPEFVENQNYRAMERGSQLMDALNPPEERDGKRLIFNRFMNSLDKVDSDY